MTRSELTVEALSSACDREAFVEAFIRLPSACRPEPYRVALQDPSSTKWLLNLTLSDSHEAWLATRDGRAVGRLHANLSWTRKGVGYIGFYEVDLRESDHGDIAKALLESASAWLEAQGTKEMYGPIDWCTWFSYRFQLPEQPDRKHGRFCWWEPVNPPEFLEHWASAGFEIVEYYHSKATDYSDDAPMAKAESELWPASERAMAAGYTFRPMGDAAKVLANAQPFFDVVSNGFAENFLFEPISLELYRASLAATVAKVDFSISWWVYAPDGTPVGFAFCFIDGDRAIGKTLVVDPAHRNKALGPSLFRFVLSTCVEKGLNTWVSALIRQGNVSDKVTRSAESYTNEAWRHRYVLLGKTLSASASLAPHAV